MDDRSGRLWTLVLAAGASSRFGGIKALAPWPADDTGGTMLSHAIATALAIGPRVLVVTGAHHAAMLPHLTVPHAFNAHWERGMGGSIACGIAALPQTAELAVILPVDQPLVTREHLSNLVSTARQTGKAVFTRQDKITGPPVALPRALFPTALLLDARGLKHALSPTQWLSVHHATALGDIDTMADLQRLGSSGTPDE